MGMSGCGKASRASSITWPMLPVAGALSKVEQTL
jgi:hypothetical protein